jgi:predicted membrane-bound spermidine synthase
MLFVRVVPVLCEAAIGFRYEYSLITLSVPILREDIVATSEDNSGR